MSESIIWDCPACEESFIGIDRQDAEMHLARCGEPDYPYHGWVECGVLPEYADELRRLMGVEK